MRRHLLALGAVVLCGCTAWRPAAVAPKRARALGTVRVWTRGARLELMAAQIDSTSLRGIPRSHDGRALVPVHIPLAEVDSLWIRDGEAAAWRTLALSGAAIGAATLAALIVGAE